MDSRLGREYRQKTEPAQNKLLQRLKVPLRVQTFPEPPALTVHLEIEVRPVASEQRGHGVDPVDQV
jgi:hypothetical protein